MSKDSERNDSFFDLDTLRQLEHLSLEEAQRRSIELLDQSSTKRERKEHLKRDIRNSKTPKNVSRIMWNAALSGSGLGVQNSAWSRMHGAAHV